MDGDQPRVRPVSPVKTADFVVHVASFRSSHKTGELEANGKVELCYMSDQHDQVRITGLARLVTDRGVIQEIWDANPLLRSFLGTIDNPEFLLYRVEPTQVRFMREWALDYHDVPV
jgi:general stress protein 26